MIQPFVLAIVGVVGQIDQIGNTFLNLKKNRLKLNQNPKDTQLQAHLTLKSSVLMV